MLNNIVLQGRLTRDPEMQATATGISRATFALACERDYKITNGDSSTDFFDVVAWRGTAEFIMRNFRKGQMIIVNGRLLTSQWTAQDGGKRKSVQIVAENVYFCGRENSGQATEQPAEQPAAVEESVFTPVETDELPF